jgi:hypothetical protein
MKACRHRKRKVSVVGLRRCMVCGCSYTWHKENMDDLGYCSEKCRDKAIRVERKKDDND